MFLRRTNLSLTSMYFDDLKYMGEYALHKHTPSGDNYNPLPFLVFFSAPASCPLLAFLLTLESMATRRCPLQIEMDLLPQTLDLLSAEALKEIMLALEERKHTSSTNLAVELRRIWNTSHQCLEMALCQEDKKSSSEAANKINPIKQNATNRVNEFKNNLLKQKEDKIFNNNPELKGQVEVKLQAEDLDKVKEFEKIELASIQELKVSEEKSSSDKKERMTQKYKTELRKEFISEIISYVKNPVNMGTKTQQIIFSKLNIPERIFKGEIAPAFNHDDNKVKQEQKETQQVNGLTIVLTALKDCIANKTFDSAGTGCFFNKTPGGIKALRKLLKKPESLSPNNIRATAKKIRAELENRIKNKSFDRRPNIHKLYIDALSQLNQAHHIENIIEITPIMKKG